MSDVQFWCLLTVVAFGTSIVSGLLGMAGGLLLLSALLWKLEPVVAVPVHGLVQLVSNASRAWFLRDQVRWRAVWRFAWPLVPAGALGLLLLQRIPPAAGRILIGVFVLAATWLPKSAREGQASPQAWRLLPLGGALIGTLAGCQIFQHASKVLLFGLGGFDFGAYLLWTLALCAAALGGTAVATRWLKGVSPSTFKLVIRLVISALAVQLVASGSWELSR